MRQLKCNLCDQKPQHVEKINIHRSGRTRGARTHHQRTTVLFALKIGVRMNSWDLLNPNFTVDCSKVNNGSKEALLHSYITKGAITYI